ncbi:MAG: hypothetical protein ACRC5M_06520, partial [Anaeroplasmataceae bacterium]
SITLLFFEQKIGGYNITYTFIITLVLVFLFLNLFDIFKEIKEHVKPNKIHIIMSLISLVSLFALSFLIKDMNYMIFISVLCIVFTASFVALSRYFIFLLPLAILPFVFPLSYELDLNLWLLILFVSLLLLASSFYFRGRKTTIHLYDNY